VLFDLLVEPMTEFAADLPIESAIEPVDESMSEMPIDSPVELTADLPVELAVELPSANVSTTWRGVQ
jgi:hypothetical protein